MAAAGRFERRRRLTEGAQFERVFANPARSADRNFTVLGRSNDLGYARLGLVVGKRVDKRAVVRNRLKRLIRESFRQQHLAGFDLVVIAKPPAAGADPATLRQSLQRLWARFAEVRPEPSTRQANKGL